MTFKNLTEALNYLDIKITEKGYLAVISLNEFHAQPLGYLSGAATLAFAETSAGMASGMILGEHSKAFPVGKSITARHLRPMKCEGSLTANATLLHKSQHSHIWEIKMLDDSNRLISKISVENAIIKI